MFKVYGERKKKHLISHITNGKNRISWLKLLNKCLAKARGRAYDPDIQGKS